MSATVQPDIRKAPMTSDTIQFVLIRFCMIPPFFNDFQLPQTRVPSTPC
jgi:hypothetical protein